MNTYQWEWTTIAALVAPRPLLFANSDNDRIFPMDGNRRIIERLRKLYGMYGKPALVDEYVSQGGHDYRPDLRVAIFQWINKHIKNDTGKVKDADFPPLPGKELRVFAKDKDIPADAINGKIDETFVPRAQVKLPEAGKFEEWQKGLMMELREKSFRGWPERIPKAEERTLDIQGSSVSWSICPRPGIESEVVTASKKKKADPRMGILLLTHPSDQVNSDTPEWAKPLVGDWTVHKFAPHIAWTKKAPPNYVERSHALLGQTVDQEAVWDVVATIRFMVETSDKRPEWRVIGRGQAGILAAYAALFEPSISEVIIVDPPTSHREGPIFLNVLRVLDIPDALGMLAPTPLTLVNAKDKAFDRTAEIYKRAGAPDKFQRK